jgi:hypothetical protein
LIALSVLLAACGTERASNESERSYKADVVEVKPNQAAFVIPATGGNLDAQAQFDSAQYLESRRVHLQRITIDKENLGGKYIPKSYVILVDRTPVARQWTAAGTTGTSTNDQSLCAESSESIQVCFQISLAAFVRDADASVYLFNFPTTKMQDGQVSGVYVATPLDSVVDNQIRQFAQRVIGEESAKRTLLQIIADKTDIVGKAESSAITAFAKQGITISYLGLGGQLGLDDKVQDVINETFIAKQRAQIAQVNATTTAINAEAARNAAEVKGRGDAAALSALREALGGDSASMGSALEGYRWDGSRVTVVLGSDTKPSVALPSATATPVPAPTVKPSGTPAPTPKP